MGTGFATGVRAQGTLLQRGDGGTPEVFATIGGIDGFDGPNETQGVLDVTCIDDTTRQKLPDGLVDGGTLSLKVNWAPYADTQQGNLRTDFAAKTLRNFKIVCTDVHATVITFAAYVTGYNGPSIAVAGKSSGTIALTISGAVTRA